MGTRWGNTGLVRVGANTVGEVMEFEINSSFATVKDTAMGDVWETHIENAGTKSWDGSLTCNWDPADTNGQNVLVLGASVTLNLYPEGNQSGDRYLSGKATITSKPISVNRESTVRVTFSFEGNGELQELTVP